MRGVRIMIKEIKHKRVTQKFNSNLDKVLVFNYMGCDYYRYNNKGNVLFISDAFRQEFRIQLNDIYNLECDLEIEDINRILDRRFNTHKYSITNEL